MRSIMKWFSSQPPTCETETELAKYCLKHITFRSHFWHFWKVQLWCDASALMIVYWFTCGLHENLCLQQPKGTIVCSSLLKLISGIIFMASVTPGMQLGSLLASHRPLLLEQELSPHSASGVCSICSYPHLLNYSVSLIPALEGSQSQLHQLVDMSYQPQEKWENLWAKGAAKS